MSTILAIESSCDETSASVVSNGEAKSNIIHSQYFHGKFGGVVPELASRAHLDKISSVVKSALTEANVELEDIDAIAVTNEPGLIGSLSIGINFAKGLALQRNLPILPINHIEGHLFSGHLQNREIGFPFIGLVVSGGHTSLFFVESFDKFQVIGSTIDDAAGEAFDKIGKMIGLEYPGGPLIDKFAKLGNSKRFDFPRPLLNEKNFNFSFSGLKTSVRYFLQKEYQGNIPEEEIKDICASAQAAICEVLVKKTVKAAKFYKCKTIVVSGGVSANSQLRIDFENLKGIEVITPDINFCIDNAAMIGFIAEKKIAQNGLEAYRNFNFQASSSSIRAARKEKSY